MNKSTRSTKISLQSFKTELVKMWPLAKGSLAQVYKPCIRPDCPACASGKKHSAFIFSYIQKRKRRCMYVPLEFVTVIRQALRNGRLLETRLSEFGPGLILQFRKQQARSGSRKKNKR